MSIDEAARGVGVAPAFQPIVSLDNNRVVGYEALARWPGQGGLTPQDVFARARAIGTADTLDARCIEAAADRALDLQWPRDTMLSLNYEPSSRHVPMESGHPVARARERFSVMFEITERGLLDHPRTLLETVERLRAQGFLIALDDVGASPDSSALLDIIAPDVIKLDLTLAQSQPDYRQAQTLSSVIAHHERTGALILAEGIETDEHLEQALALGADLGQGYRFGRPGDPGHQAPGGWSAPRLRPRSVTGIESPFDLIEDYHRVRTARKATVIALSQHLEVQASRAPDPPIMLTALQRSEFLTTGTFKRYVELAERSPLVAIFGLQIPPGLDAGIRGVPLVADDPLCNEWTVVALGPHTAAALIARENHQAAVAAADGARRFDFVITYERTLVTEAARTLLSRLD